MKKFNFDYKEICAKPYNATSIDEIEALSNFYKTETAKRKRYEVTAWDSEKDAPIEFTDAYGDYMPMTYYAMDAEEAKEIAILAHECLGNANVELVAFC